MCVVSPNDALKCIVYNLLTEGCAAPPLAVWFTPGLTALVVLLLPRPSRRWYLLFFVLSSRLDSEKPSVPWSVSSSSAGAARY